jgi:hypothetical protein
MMSRIAMLVPWDVSKTHFESKVKQGKLLMALAPQSDGVVMLAAVFRPPGVEKKGCKDIESDV